MRSAYWRPFVLIVAALAVAGVAVAGPTVVKTVRAHVPDAVRAANAQANANAGGSPSNWYDETYGTFTPKTVTGSGNQLVSLPAPGGLVTFTTGSPHYEVIDVMTVDGKYEEGGDLYSDEYGPVIQGEPSAWNVNSPQTGAPKLEIKATGAWKLVLAPMSSAPKLPAAGTESGVFRFDGPAGNWTSSFTGPTGSGIGAGSDNRSAPMFGVCQSNLVDPLNDCLGSDSGPDDPIPHRAGPSIIVVESNGRWTLK